MTTTQTTQGSEVQRLLAAIDAERSAAEQGIHGLAITARHDFITAKFSNIGVHIETLSAIIPHDEAMKLVVERWQAAESQGGNNAPSH
jgi:hypothetical protein